MAKKRGKCKTFKKVTKRIKNKYGSYGKKSVRVCAKYK